MSKIGYGYGSEWRLLWYLGRHRAELNARVSPAVGAARVDWLDFPVRRDGTALLDGEWKGLDFVTDDAILSEWRKFWPQRAGVQNWDGVGRIHVNGHDE